MPAAIEILFPEDPASASNFASAASASATAAAASATAADASNDAATARLRIERWLASANGRGPRVMASPPTVTSGGSKTLARTWYAAGGSTSYALASSPSGGYFTASRTVPIGVSESITPGLTITPGTGGQTGFGMLQQSFLHDGEDIEIVVKNAVSMVIKVDDEYVSLTPTVVSNTLTFIKLAFGSRALRRIDVIGQQLNFVGVVTAWTDALYPAPRRGPRTIMLGDSFTQAGCEMWPTYFADCMGWDDVWSAGVGGTGYVATQAGAAKKFRDRLSADVIAYAPDVVWLYGSVNDGSSSAATVQAEAEACVEQILAALPDCLVIGGYNGTGGIELMTAAALDVMDAAKAGIVAGGGVWLNPLEMPISFSGATPATTVAFATAAGRPGSGANPATITPASQGITGQTSVTPATNALPFAGAVVEIGTGAVRERVHVTVHGQTSGVIAYGFEGTARYAHAAGEPMTMKGPSYLTGRGRVGAETGFGNADLFVSSDGTHPTAAGQRALAQVQAQLLRGYLSSLL